MKHVGQLAGLFSSMLLDGAASPELVQQGYTTEEERSASGLSQVALSTFLKLYCMRLISLSQPLRATSERWWYDIPGMMWKHPMVLLMHNASNVRWWERGDGYVSAELAP